MSGSSHPELILCFLFIGLLIGTFITYVLSKFSINLPYAVVCFFVGIILSVGADNSNFLSFGDSIHIWENIGPHLILYIFLPALLFGEAMTVNIHHLKRTFWSAVLLAWPGSLLGTILLGACVKVMLPYNWSWSFCYTFGAIMCATDSVAVVALLKEVGAGPKFTMLIVQEALLNDGAALVLFNFFYDSILIDPVRNFTTTTTIIYVVKVLVISPLLGIALGLGSIFFMSQATNRLKAEDTIIQVATTLCLAYLSFFLAEYVLDISGVLCCCTSGFVLAWLAPPLILQPETMHSVWSSFEWMGNTVLFLLAGLLLGSIHITITKLDIAMVVVTYLLVQVIRVAMVVFFFPALSYLGYGLTLQESVFLSWGGLRGAVGIALALVLKQSARAEEITVSYETATKAFFIVGGVACMTFIINAVLSKRLLYALKLVDDSSEEIRIMQHYARKRIHKKTHILMETLKDKLPAFDETLVAQFCSAVTEINLSLFPSTIVDAANKSIRSKSVSQPPEMVNNIHFQNSLLKIPTNSEFHFDAPKNGYQNDDLQNDKNGTVNSTRSIAMENLHYDEDEVKSDEEQEERGRLDSASSSKSPVKVELERTDGEVEEVENAAEVENKKKKLKAERGVIFVTSPPGKEAEADNQPITLTFNNLSALQSELLFTIPSHKKRRRVAINEKLLVNVRSAFLDVVRAVYWKHIESGKLARNSTAAVLLLNSIDIAHDHVARPGLWDWDALQPALDSNQYRWIVNICRVLDKIRVFGLVIINMFRKVPLEVVEDHLTNKVIDTIDYKLLERTLYILSSFIEAHEHAQRKITLYVGEEEVTDTPEEAIIIGDSSKHVKKAKDMLDAIDTDRKNYHVSKMVARMVLATQEDMVETFQEEGILCPRDANLLITETRKQSKLLKREWLNRILGDGSNGNRSVHGSVDEEIPSFETYVRRKSRVGTLDSTYRDAMDPKMQHFEINDL